MGWDIFLFDLDGTLTDSGPGIMHAAKTALQRSGKFIPWQVVTISTDGRILDTI